MKHNPDNYATKISVSLPEALLTDARTITGIRSNSKLIQHALSLLVDCRMNDVAEIWAEHPFMSLDDDEALV